MVRAVRASRIAGQAGALNETGLSQSWQVVVSIGFSAIR
jgi:hypothetical protein